MCIYILMYMRARAPGYEYCDVAISINSSNSHFGVTPPRSSIFHKKKYTVGARPCLDQH